jgi:hypothetical protein
MRTTRLQTAIFHRLVPFTLWRLALVLGLALSCGFVSAQSLSTIAAVAAYAAPDGGQVYRNDLKSLTASADQK